MRVLVVDSYDSTHDDGHVVEQVLTTLRSNGNDVDHLGLCTSAFDEFMSEHEWHAYETDTPLQSDVTKDSAARLREADGVLFLYPTTLYGVSPRVKGWMERVLVPGVAFTLDAKQRLRPALMNVKRLGAITTTPHGRRDTIHARDLGRRMVVRTVRLNCAPLCRTTFLSMPTGSPTGRTQDQIHRTLRRWTS